MKKPNFKITSKQLKILIISIILGVVLNGTLSFLLGSLSPKDKTKTDLLSKFLYLCENNKNNIIPSTLLTLLYIGLSVYFACVGFNTFLSKNNIQITPPPAYIDSPSPQ